LLIYVNNSGEYCNASRSTARSDNIVIGNHFSKIAGPVPGISVNLVGKDSADAKPYQEREIREAMRKLQEAQEQQGRHKP